MALVIAVVVGIALLFLAASIAYLVHIDRQKAERMTDDAGCPRCRGTLSRTGRRDESGSAPFRCNGCDRQWMPARRSSGVLALERLDLGGAMSLPHANTVVSSTRPIQHAE
jgi:hypothetical protein